MYQALYRKWRPRTFEEVVGQEHITTTLKNEMIQGKPAHAYLLMGSRGTGKTTCAKLIAKAGLFAVTFLVILLVWFLVGQLLNLAFQLPILAAVNLAGGLALGLVKAALIAVVLVWLGQLFGLVPLEPDTPVLSLFTPRALGELLNRVLV